MNRTDGIGKLKAYLEKLLKIHVSKWPKVSQGEIGCIMQAVLGEDCPIAYEGPLKRLNGDPIALGEKLGLKNREATSIADAYDNREPEKLKNIIDGLS